MVKIGRTHTQDATPLTLGQEWSAYAGMLTNDLERIVAARDGVYHLAFGWHCGWCGYQLGTGPSRSARTRPAATATENAGSADGTTAGVPGLRSIDDHSEPAKTQSQNEGEYP